VAQAWEAEDWLFGVLSKFLINSEFQQLKCQVSLTLALYGRYG